MKAFKINWIGKTVLAGMLTVAAITSCEEKDFLDVPRTDQLSQDNFPAKVEDFNFLLYDLYGRLRNTMYSTNNFPRFGMLLSHEADQAYIGAEFNEFAKNSLVASNEDVTNLWNGLYENIAKANAFLSAVESFRERNADAPESIKRALEIHEGQGRFLRAFYYYQAVAYFGESFITSAADADKMGVPLITKVGTSLQETSTTRESVGNVWGFVISEMELAEKLMDGVTWQGQDQARVSIWAVKGMLGKMYLYTQQWSKAEAKLKEVIDNSGKQLVAYDVYKNMFNGFEENEFNSESLFELNHNNSVQGEWNNPQQTSNFSGILLSPAFMNNDRKYDKNGFGNLYVHDKNLQRFGYTYPDVVNENELRNGDVWKDNATVKSILSDYLENAKMIRMEDTVDPRLFVSALQPYADSINAYGAMRPVVKNQGEGINLTNNYTWSVRKHVAIDRGVWAGNGAQVMDNNLYILRLADVYLMYAEALIMSGGDQAMALEYINKVRRRAYGFPVDAPSSVDYASLNAPTEASDPVLANNPLRYERFAELFLEGYWWFDVARWKIGAQEAAYYGKVGSGEIAWTDRAYAMPIPESEINSNPGLKGKQNPGY